MEKFKSVDELVSQLKPVEPIYCIRTSAIQQASKIFQNKFPGTVLYAVKTNPHPLVIDTIIKSGIKNFDVASLKEIEQIKKTELEDVPEQTNYANVMDGIVRSLEEKAAYEEALPLLNDLLKYNRERVNISAMDPLYDRIEQAHSSMQNDEELVSTYKEHLAIKQQLGDLEGELHLLDLISYYYANTSDQKASERYQAESKRIKESLEYKKEQE